MIKAVPLDVDGTLLDTHEYIYQAFEFALNKHHNKISRFQLQQVMGKPLEECYKILTKLDDISHLAKAHYDFQKQNPSLSVPFSNAVDVLMKLRHENYHIAAITTRAKNTAYETLEQSDMLKYLDFVVTIDDVVHPKPHPEPLQKALKYLGVPPHKAVMVGDSPADIEAGKNAGTKTIGVTYGFHGEKIRSSMPDMVVDNIKEVLQYLKL